MRPEEFAAKLTPELFAAPRKRLMSRVLLIALANSQRNTPVRTGTLRRSETTEVIGDGTGGVLGTNVVYAPFVHARVPFFQKGVDDSRGAIERELSVFGAEVVQSWGGG